MTPDAMAAAGEFPTPAQFVAFAAAKGWRFVRRADGRPGLRVPDTTDPVAAAFVELLKRDPLRSAVLDAAGVPPPEPPPEVEPWECDLCGKLICVTPDEWRSVAGSPLFCGRAGAREQRGSGGRVVPAVPRCPFKGGGP